MSHVHRCAIGCVFVVLGVTAAAAPDDGYLGWSASQAESVGRFAYRQGRVGGVFDLRVLNYDYDRFWVVFPSTNAPYLQPGVAEVELVVRIHDKEGRVTWPLTPLMRKAS